MKFLTLVFYFALTWCVVAQDQMFVHTATASTIVDNKTYIDHPDLNQNPDAKIVITHNYNPPGSVGVYNTRNTGVLYDSTEEKWAIQNENVALTMFEDSSYNIYVARNDEVIEHIATATNQGTGPFYTVLDHPLLNETPRRIIVFSTYFNPNEVYNNKRYGMFYDELNLDRVIYTEDFSNIPLNSAFFVVIEGDNVQSFRHEATPENIVDNISIIDHPNLNNNPDAVIILSHNWGIAGDASNVIINKTQGVQYTGTNWAIYIEDQSPMPEDAKFDVIINAVPLGLEERDIANLRVYPNPVSEILSVSAESVITQVKIFSIGGTLLLSSDEIGNQLQLDISHFTSGIYFAEIHSEENMQTIKLVKK